MSVEENTSKSHSSLHRRARLNQEESPDTEDDTINNKQEAVSAQQSARTRPRPLKRHQQERPQAQGDSTTLLREEADADANSPRELSEQATTATTTTTSAATAAQEQHSKRQFSIESLLTQTHDEEVDSLNVSPAPSPSDSNWTFTALAGSRRASRNTEVDSELLDEQVLHVAEARGTKRGRSYTLHLVSLPIQCTTDGQHYCDPPLVVKLGIAAEQGESRLPAGAQIYGEDDLPYMSARVVLYEQSTSSTLPSSSSIATASPLPRLPGSSRRNSDGGGGGNSQDVGQQWIESQQLVGQLHVRPRVFQEPKGSSEVESSIYFCFPRLQIVRPGAYRFRVSLFGHWDEAQYVAVGVEDGATQEIVQVMAEASTLAVPENSPLAVGRVQVSHRTAELLDNLNGQGARLL